MRPYAKAVLEARKARGAGFSGEGSRLDNAMSQQNDGYLNDQAGRSSMRITGPGRKPGAYVYTQKRHSLY